MILMKFSFEILPLFKFLSDPIWKLDQCVWPLSGQFMAVLVAASQWINCKKKNTGQKGKNTVLLIMSYLKIQIDINFTPSKIYTS
jgi:hypothetical protein